MGIVFTDRAKETTTSTGLYNLNLDGAAAGFVALPDTGNFYYCIQNEDGSEWEVGIGSCSGTVFFRGVTPLSSSTGSKVDFSAGTKYIFCVAPAYHHTKTQELLSAVSSNRGMGLVSEQTENDTPGSLLVSWPVPFTEACGIAILCARYTAITDGSSGPVKAWEGTFRIESDAVVDFTKTVVADTGSSAADITGVTLSAGDISFGVVGVSGSDWNWTITVDVLISVGSGC